MIVLQFHKPMVVGFGAYIEKGEVPTVRIETKEALQIVIDEQKGTISIVEGKK